MKRKWKQSMAVLLVVALVFGSSISNGAFAAAKPKLNKKKVSLTVGKTVKLRLLHKKKAVKWSSSKKAVASVNGSGLVKAKKAGKAVITAKSAGKKYRCTVTVKAKNTDATATVMPTATLSAGLTVPTIAPPRITATVAPTVTPTAGAGQKITAPGESSKPGTEQSASPQESGTPGADETQFPQESDTPGADVTQSPQVSEAPGADKTHSPEASETPGADKTQSPQASATPGTEQTVSPAPQPTATDLIENPGETEDPQETEEPEDFNGATTPSEEEIPTDCDAKVLGVGSMRVSLGMSKTEVTTAVGGAPDYIQKSPLGFEEYIYNPSMDYTNYLILQFDGDKVVAMSTISSYFAYGNLVKAGDKSSALTEKGFGSLSKYDYEKAYEYEDSDSYVLAFVNHQGDGGLYGMEVFAKETSLSSSMSLDDWFKVESTYVNYSSEINRYMAQQMFDLACAFRKTQGLLPYTASNKTGAQSHAEDMAANDFVDTTGTDGSSMSSRFDSCYGYYTGASEVNCARSVDAFGMLTWAVDDTDTSSYTSLTKSTDKSGNTITKYYLCTGFANNTTTKDKTYATFDLYFF